ncbi:MAG: hypothetical protein E6I75_00930 [Chloroflexi bacterium]|nr:MAG: hypothetical protein E6I75_00930 [Chloroflexota bacterium]
MSWRDLIASVLIAVVTPLAMLVFTPTAARSLGRRWLFLLPVAFCAGAEMPNASYLIALVQLPAQVVSGQFADLPDTPREPLTTFTTASGIQVYVPVEGDQIWDAPLPATPYPNPALRLCCPDSLECGFAV